MVRRRAACVAVALCLLVPRSAAAQRQTFLEGLLEFTSAVAGTFGDEGPRLRSALDRMEAGLVGWDRDIRALEADLAARPANAPPALAFQLHVAAAVAYVDRLRLADAMREIDAASRIEPGHPNLLRLRALVLDASGRTKEATDASRAVWQQDPANPGNAYLFLRHA
jgi:tetratricopeptide (TPR) repeat protein